ncbi:hypothetical protein BX283_0474 [Streptomyces sp. TLI_146]|nr:hypothetical protein BX283_0474 [Streptomyces sp. TLI_146]
MLCLHRATSNQACDSPALGLPTSFTTGMPGDGRGARGETELLTAAAKGNRRKVLTFHSRAAEAETMAHGVVGVAEQLGAHEPRMFPPTERVWAD